MQLSQQVQSSQSRVTLGGEEKIETRAESSSSEQNMSWGLDTDWSFSLSLYSSTVCASQTHSQITLVKQRHFVLCLLRKAFITSAKKKKKKKRKDHADLCLGKSCIIISGDQKKGEKVTILHKITLVVTSNGWKNEKKNWRKGFKKTFQNTCVTKFQAPYQIFHIWAKDNFLKHCFQEDTVAALPAGISLYISVHRIFVLVLVLFMSLI